MPLAIILFLALAPAPPALSPSARDRLDRSALRLPGDTLGANEVRAVEQLPGRLFSCEELTPEDEARRASATRERILDGRAADAAPRVARRVFDRLVHELPSRLKPAAFHYRLTVLDQPRRDAFTVGGGEVYITRPELDGWLADKERGEAALAFVLADEIAHDALGHTRRAWLWQDAVNAAGGLLPIPAARAFLAGAFGTESPGRFTYTAAEQEAADVFALHLCRNAGFDADAVLDPARLAARAHLDDKEEGQTDDTDGSLLRLKRLLSERDGLFDDETAHGLFVYDRASGRLARCGPRQVGPGEAPIIFVHGLRGTLYAFDAYLDDYGKRPELAGRPLLVFHYPNDESLSRCGQFLAREMRRCVADPERAVFVCHSAGGLAVRWYTEVRGGGFDRVIFLATPHAGTSLASLTGFVDFARFCINLPYGLDFALADEFGEGHGAIADDLQTDSLFLRYLGRGKPPTAKYQIFYGQLFDYFRGLQYQVEVALAAPFVAGAVGDFIPFPACQARTRRRIAGLTLPEEIAHGDLSVSAASACLPGVEKTTRLPLWHEEFRSDPGVIRRVLAAVLGR